MNGFDSSFLLPDPKNFEDAGEDVDEVAGEGLTGESEEGTVKTKAFRFVAVSFLPSVSLPALTFDCGAWPFFAAALLAFTSASELDASSGFETKLCLKALGTLGVDMLFRGCMAFWRSNCARVVRMRGEEGALARTPSSRLNAGARLVIGTVFRAATDVDETVFFSCLDFAPADRVVRDGPAFDASLAVSAGATGNKDAADAFSGSSSVLALLAASVNSFFRFAASSSFRSCSWTARSSSS